MTEKYKLYLTEDMRSRLVSDAELFEFTKSEGSINLNSFLKEVLVNYYEQYRARKEDLLDTILSDLSEFSSISDEDAGAIADKIINTYMRNDRLPSKRSEAITLTVSGRSYDVMRSIENNMLSHTSLSQYINDMLSSYLSFSRNNREMIIFRETFDEINAAIKKNSIITFSSSSAERRVFRIMPYMIAASKEEQCNYLLCVDAQDRLLRTFRISRIRALFTTSDKFIPNEETKRQLKEIAIRNPQSASKNVKIIVRLTDRGVKKFKLVVKNRPDVEKKDGNTYYFNWPKRELLEYFKRFGEDAIIESPEDCRESIRIFHEKAAKAYKKPDPAPEVHNPLASFIRKQRKRNNLHDDH